VNPLTAEDLMQHADTLYRFALSKVGDHHAAEDLVQDVLIAAWKKADAFRGDSPLSTWLLGIMKFKVIDYFRKAGRTPTARASIPDDDKDPLEALFDHNGSWKVDPNHGLDRLAGSPDTGAWHREVVERIKGYMDRLPERLRLLFGLREIDGLDVSSAAAAAGVTPGSAAVLLTRSRQRLRMCLQYQGIEP
jgi:RNA polymerase sigma-70 factor (ECF subfamily)